jgi:hypothetical protein
MYEYKLTIAYKNGTRAHTHTRSIAACVFRMLFNDAVSIENFI